MRASATGKVCSPRVERRVGGTTSAAVDADLRRRLQSKSVTRWMLYARYDGHIMQTSEDEQSQFVLDALWHRSQWRSLKSGRVRVRPLVVSRRIKLTADNQGDISGTQQASCRRSPAARGRMELRVSSQLISTLSGTSCVSAAGLQNNGIVDTALIWSHYSDARVDINTGLPLFLENLGTWKSVGLIKKPGIGQGICLARWN